jgi:hypothetical protein
MATAFAGIAPLNFASQAEWLNFHLICNFPCRLIVWGLTVAFCREQHPRLLKKFAVAGRFSVECESEDERGVKHAANVLPEVSATLGAG